MEFFQNSMEIFKFPWNFVKIPWKIQFPWKYFPWKVYFHGNIFHGNLFSMEFCQNSMENTISMEIFSMERIFPWKFFPWKFIFHGKYNFHGNIFHGK